MKPRCTHVFHTCTCVPCHMYTVLHHMCNIRENLQIRVPCFICYVREYLQIIHVPFFTEKTGLWRRNIVNVLCYIPNGKTMRTLLTVTVIIPCTKELVQIDDEEDDGDAVNAEVGQESDSDDLSEINVCRSSGTYMPRMCIMSDNCSY